MQHTTFRISVSKSKMLRIVLLGLLCSLAASSTIPVASGSVSYSAQYQIDLNTLNAGIANIENTDTPTADQLKAIIAQLNDPATQLTQEQLDAKKNEAVQAITPFKNAIDELNSKATAILAKYEGQSGPEIDKIKAAAQAIQTGTSAISSNLAAKIASIQAATTQDDLKNALNGQDLYNSMVLTEQFIQSSKAALNNISVPTEEVKQKINEGLEKLKEAVEEAKQTLADKTKELEDLKKQITSYVTPEKLQELKDRIQSLLNSIKEKLKESKDTANNLISELPKTIDSSAQQAVDAAKSAAQNVLAKVQSATESLNNLLAKVTSATNANDLNSKLSTVVNKLKSTLTNLLDSTIEFVNNAIDRIQSYLNSLLSGAGELITGLVDDVQGYLSGFTGLFTLP